MWFGVITIFPEMFAAVRDYGINKKAIKNNLVNLNLYNPRDYIVDKKSRVDDRPYGGGPGMVMKVEPLMRAIEHAIEDSRHLNVRPKVVLLSPQGYRVTQQSLIDFVKLNKELIFVCGRYEGIDERLCNLAIDEEWSIGDFVLSGGELAAMAFIDAMIRLVPGVLGDPNSLLEESFYDHKEQLLDHPHYTRPECIYNLQVPDVLLSGDHQAIAAWRREQRMLRTKERRKDLLGGKVYDN